ncbi:MAG: hypothetical protein EXX96DRAFT_487781 [Benjaminiella poitrasii]|nr:MAG: hypothetical protein EXX96DRAFT_487781 [Benjaminiella poitrasii]
MGFLHRKLPTTKFLHTIQLISISVCRLCNAVIDTIDRFLVLCSHKLQIWSSLLPKYFPAVHFTPFAILQILMYLNPPSSIRRLDISRLFTFVNTMLWPIWVYYWQYIMQNIPYNYQTLINSI